MTRIAEIADRLHRLAKWREDEGIYNAALCEEAAAYLSAALAAEPGEAVAECTKFNAVGRKCVGGECDWHRAYIVMESILRESQDRCRKLQAKLDTHPAPSGQTVAVKPLEWKWDAHTSQWWANSVVGQYHAWEVTGYAYFRAGAFSTEKAGGTADEAKAAAQADYENRVLSALAHPLPLKEEVERVLEKMAEGWANVLELDLIPRQHRMSASILRDDARSLLSRLRAGAQEGWKPIETAPKDGSPFLAFGSYVYEGDTAPTIYMRVAEYSGDPNWPWRDAEGLHRETFYSHWMPLPTAPSPEAKGGPRP